MTIEEIDSVEQFVDNLEKLELPNQLVAVLADPLLQKLLILRPDTTADARISNWLESSIADAADNAQADGGSALLDLLELVHDHAEQTQVCDSLGPSQTIQWRFDANAEVTYRLSIRYSIVYCTNSIRRGTERTGDTWFWTL